MKTTLLVPRGSEAAAVRRARPSARVVELPAGIAAASALPELEAGEVVIVLGLCGALRQLKAGDVAIYGHVVDASQRALALDPALIGALRAALPGAVVVEACTADRVVTTVGGRIILAQRFDADVVDMEGTHVAAALAARGVRCAMVRVVSDDASRDLPPIGDAIHDGRVQPLRIAVAFARAPRAAFAFVRDVRSALAALTATVRSIEGVRA